MALQRSAHGAPLTFRGFSFSKILDALYGSTRGAVLHRGSADWQILAPSTSGYFLKSQGSGANPIWASVGFINQAVVTGSAATSLTLSGLDLDAHGGYFLHVEFDNALTLTTITVDMTFNADTTTTNYDAQNLIANGATNTASRNNTGYFMTVGANETVSTTGFITKTVENYPRSVLQSGFNKTTALEYQGLAHNWRTTATNVTGITLTASNANALAVGSSITVWKIST